MDKTIEKLRQIVPGDIFTDKEVLPLIDGSNASRYNKIKRAFQKGTLIPLKRGVYAFPPFLQKRGIHPFCISNKLYWPSYVSLESALNHYQLIPEGVRVVTSVTPGLDQKYQNHFGWFTYKHLPLSIFETGFISQKFPEGSFLMATPLKALLDTLYIKKKKFKTLSDFEEDLRLDLNTLKKLLKELPNKEIVLYKEIYKVKRMRKMIDILLWDLL